MKSLLALALAGVGMTPCLWDSDTLDTELRGLPDAFDLVVGKWHRHSDAYYQVRVDMLLAKTSLTLGDYDDLAVAYEHLGQRDKAIEVMAQKAESLLDKPDTEHQYRYHANLGTFYAHSGKLEEALVELRAAVEIHPDAHFGREHFQIELIEYVAAAKKDPNIWKRRSFLRHAGYAMTPVIVLDEKFLEDFGSPEERARDWYGKRPLDWQQAYKAIAGMLRFGGREGAELYRSLGELYLQKQHLNLAWWALGRAIERGHPAAAELKALRQGIVRHWDEARSHENTGHTNPTMAEYEAQRSDADRWSNAFQVAEVDAIDRGKDVSSDAVLASLLDIANRAVPKRAVHSGSGLNLRMATLVSCVALFVLLFVLRARAHTQSRA